MENLVALAIGQEETKKIEKIRENKQAMMDIIKGLGKLLVIDDMKRSSIDNGVKIRPRHNHIYNMFFNCDENELTFKCRVSKTMESVVLFDNITIGTLVKIYGEGHYNISMEQFINIPFQPTNQSTIKIIYNLMIKHSYKFK